MEHGGWRTDDHEENATEAVLARPDPPLAGGRRRHGLLSAHAGAEDRPGAPARLADGPEEADRNAGQDHRGAGTVHGAVSRISTLVHADHGPRKRAGAPGASRPGAAGL